MSEWINPIGTTTDAEVKGIPISNSVKVGIPCGVCGGFVELHELDILLSNFVQTVSKQLSLQED